ncbi:unnamed protein product [Protopolystoma xenopodis]|uniref:Uncharacterized protein n=1 Tax=Protopolystoma xenopodis TaxID=117903 RepID=A0A3S5FHB9_9PLAT|nr:unnamed protein product [Protopolystoma xenopodis]
MMESRLGTNLRSKVELQRRSAAEAHSHVVEVTRRAESAESELARVKDELAASHREKQVCILMRESLRIFMHLYSY